MATNNQIIGLMFANYGETNELRLKGYCMEFAGVNTNLLMAAVRKLQKESRFVPAIADIYQAMDSLKETVTGEVRFLDWPDAWDEIYKGWRDGSPYKPQPKWSTPEIARTVECFGWLSLLESPAEHVMAIRAQMKTMYEATVKKSKEHGVNDEVLGIVGVPKEQLPAKLAGLISQIGTVKAVKKK